MKRYQAQEWQKDPQSLQGERGQLWSENGIMLGVRPTAVLKEMIKEGKAFVMTCQAIGLYDKE